MNHYDIFVELLFLKLLKPYLVARHHQLCDSRPLNIRCSVTEFVISNVSKQHNAFIFKDQPLRMKALCFFRWWGAACQRHVVVIHKIWILRYTAALASNFATSYRDELPVTHWSDACHWCTPNFGCVKALLCCLILCLFRTLSCRCTYTSVPSLMNERLRMHLYAFNEAFCSCSFNRLAPEFYI
jgi:hypothetical protein